MKGEALTPAERFVRPAPLNLAPPDAPAFASSIDCECAPIETHLLNDVAFNAGGELFDARDVLECSFLDRERFEARDRGRYARRHAAVWASAYALSLDPGQDLVWIADRHSQNFHHWLCDALPRLEAWLQRHATADLVMPGRALGEDFVRESLEAYGDRVRVIAQPGEASAARVERLVAIGRTASTEQQHDRLVATVAARLLRRYGGERATTGRRVHISRAKARLRRIVNESELTPVFARHGFETVFTEELSLAEQVAMMVGARALVGAHGAGLTNMMFMPPGGSVLELRQLYGPPNCFFTLAGASGHGYRYLACEAHGRPAHPHAADFRVDPHELDHALAALQA